MRLEGFETFEKILFINFVGNFLTFLNVGSHGIETSKTLPIKYFHF